VAQIVGPLELGRPNGPMTIAGLARANKNDIERCYDAVRHAPKHRIHCFLATSDIHLKHKLKMSRSECLAQAISSIEFARGLCDDIEFSPEDAGRSDREFLAEVCAAAIEAGVSTLNIPDTVGYTLPVEYHSLIKYLIANTPGADQVVWSTHCHNDLGMATANTLAGVSAGARQVEVTVNGIGERAGNTALEEVVMAMHTRPMHFPVACAHINTEGLMRASHLVSRFTGMSVQPNKAIVGANAFAHEAGIHQDGMLKHASTYEIMTPASVGLAIGAGPTDKRANELLVLGKHSGRAAYKDKLRAMGYGEHEVSEEMLTVVVNKCKNLADVKKTVSEEDLEAIVVDELYKPSYKHWEIVDIHVTAGTLVRPTATVTMRNSLEKKEVPSSPCPKEVPERSARKKTPPALLCLLRLLLSAFLSLCFVLDQS
jgi:2-isopropylmalate synthase